jgi:hypothetical protein
MRRVLLALLIPFAAAQAACSFGTEFVVINCSGQPVEVRYRVVASRSPVEARTLAKTTNARLRTRDKGWQELTAEQYELRRDGAVAVRLSPGESLRVALVSDYELYKAEESGDRFAIEEIAISGADGNARYWGAQARQAFVRESMQLYTITYR